MECYREMLGNENIRVPGPEEVLIALETARTMGLLEQGFATRFKFGVSVYPVAIAETFRHNGRVKHRTFGQADFPFLDAVSGKG